MSLQVWLPLNGNLKNQGLCNYNFTNNGATISNTGKIGKCYSFNGTSSYLITDFKPAEVVPNEMSFCCWIKLKAIDKAHTLFCSRTKVGAGLSIFIVSANKLRFDNMGNTNSADYKTTFDYTFAANIWYHIAVIQTSTHKKLYINGVLKQTIAKTPGSGANTSSSNSATKASIGASGVNNANDNYLNGYMNDVRIYDHCLSDKEVKEISKGLILHYKLNNLVNPNLLIDSNAPSLTKVNATKNRYIEVSSSGSYTVTFEELTDPPEIGIKYGVRQKNTSGSSMHSVTWYSGLTISVSAIPYTMSCYVKRISEETNLKIKFQYGKSSPYKSTTQNIINDHEWHKYSWTFTPQTASGQAAASGTTKIYPGGMSVSPGEVLICGWKLEQGTTATSWILNPAEPGYNDLFNMYNTIYDSSGYWNNGTIQGTLIASSDTFRYNTALFSNGTSGNKIKLIDSLENQLYIATDKKFSFSLWLKLNNRVASTMPLAIKLNNNLCFNFGPSGQTQEQFLIFDGTKYWGSPNSFVIPTNEWHHWVGTFDGTTEKLYEDGVLIQSNTNTTNYTYDIDTTEVTFFGNVLGTKAINGAMSDIRIYATALSDADVLELYNTSASIDSSGNAYARELVE